MITYEIKPDAEFTYDLRALAGAFFPDKKVKIKEITDWADDEDYPIRIFHKKSKLRMATIRAPYTKEDVKQLVYEVLSEKANSQLPWGILTGIRPAKIANELLHSCENRHEAFEVLMDKYLVFPEKAELALDVAANETLLMKDYDHDRGYNIYIGIPFCPSICEYCSFSSYPYDKYKDRVGLFLDSLDKELVFVDEFIHAQREKRILHSIYVGGGTPTSLSESELERFMDMVHRHLPTRECMEFTVEAGRPDSITHEKLQVLKDAGVTRISINPQSMLDSTLKRLGRTHTATQIREAFRAAREVGFDDINMDLIVGLPEEDEVDFYNTLNQVYDLGPDSITVHTLVIKRASRLRREQIEYDGGDIRPEDTLIPVLQRGSYDYLKAHGYEPYYMYRQKNALGATRNTNQENVSYSRLGKECLYNIFMMEDLEDIIGFGCGASSKHRIASENRYERIENVKSVEDYISRTDEMIDRKRKEFLST